MGQSKGGGYMKKDAVTPEQKMFLDQILGQSAGNGGQAAAGYAQFLPGGGGGKAIADAAQNRFQQQTVPSIMNAFGSNSKGSSALNQALAGGAANLNTDIASMLAQAQLQASQGLGNLSLGQGQLGSKDQFAYLQRQMPFWQSLLLQGAERGAQQTGQWLGGGG